MCSTTFFDLLFRFKQILLFVGISSLLKAPLPALAQTRITGDSTLPTQVNSIQGGIYEITGGSRPQNGSNLFHSLNEFSIQSGDTARFVHDTGIQNILTRVTGNLPSNINGTIQTWIDGVQPSTANLFLINPQGIIFGANATLDIGGSFIGSTAEKIKFADGTEFSAINPSTKPLLTISVPLGLQFGSNYNGSISINGSGNNLKANPNSPIDRSNRPSGLNYQNSNNQILALIGNEIILDGGNVTFTSGTVELWSVKQGEVSLVDNNGKLKLEKTQGIEYSNINLLNAASVDTSGNSGGSIKIRGKDISLEDGSVIVSDTLGNGSGAEINISASESLAVQGFIFNPNNQVFSSILANVASGATGDGGKINLETKTLQVVDGGQISNGSFGIGNAGELNVKADNIQMSGQSAIATPVLPGARGNGGNLSIETNSLKITDGAQILSNTFGFGKAGDLQIKAKDIEVVGISENGPSGIFTTVENAPAIPQLIANSLGIGMGTGGNLNIETGSLRVSDGAQIAVGTRGSGNAGNMRIQANSVELVGSSPFSLSGLFANAVLGNGEGGDLNLNTDKLIIRDRATINVSNFLSSDSENLRGLAGTGAAGNINISSPFILLENQGTITANTNTGDKGNINIESQNLQMLQASSITSNANNSSDGGNILIITDTLVGLQNSDITANAMEGFGGRVTINAQSIFGIKQSSQLTPESDITASSNLGTEFNGVVQLNTPDTDPNSGVNELPTTIIDGVNQITAGCAAQKGNTFIVSNRGGLPQNPTATLRGTNLWLDLRTAFERREKTSNSYVTNSKSAIVEATGWVKGKDGELYFVAENQTGTGVYNRSWDKIASCGDFK